MCTTICFLKKKINKWVGSKAKDCVIYRQPTKHRESTTNENLRPISKLLYFFYPSPKITLSLSFPLAVARSLLITGDRLNCSKLWRNGLWVDSEVQVLGVNAGDGDRGRGRARRRKGLHIMHHFQYPGSNLQATRSTGLYLLLLVYHFHSREKNEVQRLYVIVGVWQNQGLRESDFRAFWRGRNQGILDWLLHESSSVVICLQVGIHPPFC